MTDLASLILGIPSYIEGFVELGRTVRKYQSLTKDHVETVEDAIFCAGTLDYYSGFIDVKDPDTLNHPSRPLLEEALAHAYDALDTAQTILLDWSLRLNPDSKPHGRMFLAKLMNSVADRIIRSKSGKTREIPTPKRISKLLSEAAYLAFGAIEIREAMARLNKWITRLSQLLLTSPNLKLCKEGCEMGIGKKVKKAAGDLAFVARARRRLNAARPVPVINFEQLDSMFDIDPEHNSGVYRLEKGDYAGCMVDIRDLNLWPYFAAFEAEKADTLTICRLLAEEPSEREVGERPSVGILPCVGYTIGKGEGRHYLFFRLPPGTGSPCTLRSLLTSASGHHSLNARLEFCIKLATSVLMVHSLGLVHKNIRPDSILIVDSLRSDNSPTQLGTPYLISFGQARLAQGVSHRRPYDGEELAQSIYIHPRHTSCGKRIKWQMRDDVFCLGVCLFEIAVWRSLLKWDEEAGGLVLDADFLPITDEHYTEILLRRGRSIQHDKVWMRRSDIIKYASEMIPATMGETFRDIVVKCLHFGDDRILSDEEVLDITEEKDSKEKHANLQSVTFVEEILTNLRALVFAL